MASAAGLMVASSEAYSRRHSASQLVGSLFPALQKHRFYLGEARAGRRASPGARLAPLAKRGAYLAATAIARPIARLETAAGHAAITSFFLEPAPPAPRGA